MEHIDEVEQIIISHNKSMTMKIQKRQNSIELFNLDHGKNIIPGIAFFPWAPPGITFFPWTPSGITFFLGGVHDRIKKLGLPDSILEVKLKNISHN